MRNESDSRSEELAQNVAVNMQTHSPCRPPNRREVSGRQKHNKLGKVHKACHYWRVRSLIALTIVIVPTITVVPIMPIAPTIPIARTIPVAPNISIVPNISTASTIPEYFQLILNAI